MFPCLWCGASVQPGHTGCNSCHRSLLINGYHFDGFLGRGGIGSVYSATNSSGQRVAAKVVALSQGADWKTFELFEKSSHMLQSLSHPGIPKMYGFAKSDDGKLFLFRECFDGGTLQDRIQQGVSLEPHNIRSLFDKLLQVLHYLHGRIPPIYHRDIKPSNIMFRSAMSWDPVFVDFDTVTFDTQRTGNTIIGTPGYTAPEQFAGMISPASDLYSLGATMLYVSTHVEPDALPKRDGRFQVAHLLKNLEESSQKLILQLLEPERQNRPQSAQDAMSILGSSPQKPSSLGFNVSFKGDPPGNKQNVGPHKLQGLSVAPQDPIVVKNLPKISAPRRSSPLPLLLGGGVVLLGVAMSFFLLARSPSPSIESMAPYQFTVSSAPVDAPVPIPVEAIPEVPVALEPKPNDVTSFEMKPAVEAPKPEKNGKAPEPQSPYVKTPFRKSVKKLEAAEVSAVMKAAKDKFADCGTVGEGRVNVKFTILGSGQVSSVSADNENEKLSSCVAKVAKGLVFPAFDADPQMSVNYPVIVAKK